MKQPNEEQESHVILETRLVQPFAWLILVVLFIWAAIVWHVGVMFLCAIGAYMCFQKKDMHA